MQRLLGGWGPPLPKAPSSVVGLGAPCTLGLDLQVIRLTPSGVPTTLVLVNCYQVGVPGLGPGGVPREPHHGHWMEQGGTLEASSSSPFLLTPTLANLDYLLGQKPGFLSGPPLPILEIGESVGCPGPFPKPFGQGRSQRHLCNNVCVTLPSATGTGECTLFWG